MLIDSPLAFVSSPSDDLFASLETTRERLQRGTESMIFGAFDPELVGAVGLYRDRHVKSSHKAHLWGMFVTPDHRHRGIAFDLLKFTLDRARHLTGVSWVQLSVSSAAPAAREPDALRLDGQSVIEYHMALRLEDDP
jgi:GNAT superfamily N-acetyltransferase